MDGAALTGCKMEVFFWDLVSGGLFGGSDISI
jgi:hypothetical protein